MKANEKNLPATKLEWMAFIHKTLSNGVRAAKSHAPREWLAKRGLNMDVTGACFNSGQMHHRKELSFKQALAEVGFMQQSTVGVNTDTVPYTVFGIFSIMFPLRNERHEVVNFYSIRIVSGNCAYMNDEQGLYPGYPDAHTKRLFVVNTVLDAATMIQSRVLDNKEAVLALHEGQIKAEHEQAIRRLTGLTEVIYLDTQIPKVVKETKVWDKTKK